jgi:hypothetical protein
MGQTASGALTVIQHPACLAVMVAKWIVRRRVFASSILAMTMAGGALAVDNAPPAPAVAGPQPSTEELLRKIENQLLAGHMLSPATDNAMETWQEVLDRQVANPTAPEMVRALTAFAAETKARAAEAQAVGQIPLATEFNVFAEQATHLADDGRNDAAGENAAGTAVETPLVDRSMPASAAPPTAVAAGEGGTPEAASKSVSVARPAAPVTASRRTDHDGTPAPVAASAAGGVDPRMAALYIRRGDDLLAHKDITAARKFYQYAAEAGIAQAATALAKTYDAAFIGRLGVIGLKPDPALAALWYRRGAEGGDQQAVALLARSPPEIAK